MLVYLIYSALDKLFQKNIYFAEISSNSDFSTGYNQIFNLKDDLSIDSFYKEKEESDISFLLFSENKLFEKEINLTKKLEYNYLKKGGKIEESKREDKKIKFVLEKEIQGNIINTNNNNVYRKDAYYKHFKSIFARYIKCKANKLKNCCFPNFNKNNFAALAYKYTGNPKEKDNYNFLKFTIKELLILGKNPKNKNRQYNNELLIKYIENHEETAKDKMTYIELINFLNNTVESELMKFYRNKTEFESINKDAKCLFFDKYYKNETGISLLEIDGFIKILKIKCK